LAAQDYGDAAIPLKFMTTQWAKYFELVSFTDDPDRFWPAVVVARKP
jgi:hypothetical protein